MGQPGGAGPGQKRRCDTQKLEMKTVIWLKLKESGVREI